MVEYNALSYFAECIMKKISKANEIEANNNDYNLLRRFRQIGETSSFTSLSFCLSFFIRIP